MKSTTTVPVLAAVALSLALAASASAQPVDISAVGNCSPTGGTGVFVPLAAGTYIMRPVARAFMAWDPWGTVTGCEPEDGNCTTGFVVLWTVIYEDNSSDSYPDPFGGIWSTPLLALQHSGPPGILTLDKAQTVQFCILDTPCADNLGGVSLDVIACRADFDHNAITNSTDVGEFINAWFADQVKGTLTSDWDANGIVNSTDVGEFINSWFEDIAAGCG